MRLSDIGNINFPCHLIETVVEVLISVLFIVIGPRALKTFCVEIEVENLWQLTVVEAAQAIIKCKHVCKQTLLEL